MDLRWCDVMRREVESSMQMMSMAMTLSAQYSDSLVGVNEGRNNKLMRS